MFSIFTDLPKDNIYNALSMLSSADLMVTLTRHTLLSKEVSLRLSIIAMEILFSRHETYLDFDYHKKAMHAGLGCEAERQLYENQFIVHQLCNNVIALLSAKKSDLAHKIQGITFLAKMKQIPFSNELLDNVFAAPINNRTYLNIVAPLVSKKRATEIIAQNNVGFQLYREPYIFKLCADLAHIAPLLDTEQRRNALEKIIAALNTPLNEERCYLTPFSKLIPMFSPEQLNRVFDCCIRYKRWNCLAVLSAHTEKSNEIVSLITTSLSLDGYNGRSLYKAPLALLKHVLPQLAALQITPLFDFALNVATPIIAVDIIVILRNQLNKQQVLSILNTLPNKLEHKKDILVLLAALAKKMPEEAIEHTSNSIMTILNTYFVNQEIDHDTINACIPNLTNQHISHFFDLFIAHLTPINARNYHHMWRIMPTLIRVLNKDHVSTLKNRLLPMLSANEEVIKIAYHALIHLAPHMTTTERSNLIDALPNKNHPYAKKLIACIAAYLTKTHDIEDAWNEFVRQLSNDAPDHHFYLLKLMDFIPQLTSNKAEQAALLINNLIFTNLFTDQNRHPLMPFDNISRLYIRHPQQLALHVLDSLLSHIKDQFFIMNILHSMLESERLEKRLFAVNQISKRLFSGEFEGFDLKPQNMSQEAMLLSVMIDMWNKINTAQRVEQQPNQRANKFTFP